MSINNRRINKYYQSIIHNFDVSLVLPFYKRTREFSKVLPLNASYFQRNGIEVIIVMDEPTEEGSVIRLIEQYPFINWKTVVNDTIHEPRNPAKVINVGIRHASKKYVMVSSPETQLYTDVIYQLRNVLEYYPGHYAIGTVAFIQEDSEITDDLLLNSFFIPYGSFMAKKEQLFKITGYDESFKDWGGEDDNIRRRLDMAGIDKVFVPDAKSLHYEKELKFTERQSTSYTPREFRKIKYPKTPKPNGEKWGTEFNRITYDWKNKRNAEKLCRNYLSDFLQFKINRKHIFKEKYERIVLCQSHNETEMLSGFLENMANYFDGIVLLDDESTDGTYDLAEHDKILLKVQKSRMEFNDLENKNLLLDIASFIHSDWLCFMDIDERIDSRFANFETITNNPSIDVATFCFIHLWDDENFYNAQYPYTMNGLFRMPRMFRNLGRLQINSLRKKLHFVASPLKKNLFDSTILVMHRGNLSKKRRMKRYNFYKNEDTCNDQSSYEHLLVEKPELKKVKNIDNEILKTI